ITRCGPLQRTPWRPLVDHARQCLGAPGDGRLSHPSGTGQQVRDWPRELGTAEHGVCPGSEGRVESADLSGVVRNGGAADAAQWGQFRETVYGSSRGVVPALARATGAGPRLPVEAALCEGGRRRKVV